MVKGERVKEHTQLITGLSFVPKSKSHSSKRAEEKYGKGEQGSGNECREGTITGSVQGLIRSVENNVAVLMLIFAVELEQRAGWRSGSAGD